MDRSWLLFTLAAGIERTRAADAYAFMTELANRRRSAAEARMEREAAFDLELDDAACSCHQPMMAAGHHAPTAHESPTTA